MKRTSAIILQALVVLIGIFVFGFLLWEPQVEGVNAHATLFQIYFTDPFLAYTYIASIPFFVGLYQVFTLLGLAGNQAFLTQRSVQSLQIIQYCASLMPVFILGGVIWLLLSESDDRPPIIMMGTVTLILSVVIAVIATKGRRHVQHAIHSAIS